MEDRYKGLNRRESVRLSKVLKVKFILINEETSEELTGILFGSIRNISAGGALLEIYDLSEEWIEGLISGMIKIVIEVEIPDVETPVKTLCRAVWFSRINKGDENKIKYILGLKFVDITVASQDIIKNYVIKSYMC